MEIDAIQVDIVIVNWNTGAHLAKCLESIDCALDGIRARVTVVDNASSDGSQLNLPVINAPVQVLGNSHNLGFARACNIGALCEAGEFLLFLNPDMVLQPRTIRTAIEKILDPECAPCGAVGVQLRTAEGEVARTCAMQPTAIQLIARAVGLHRLPSELWRDYILPIGYHTGDRDVEHIIGAFYLIPRDLFMRIGMFDARFFVYLEDLDFSRRLLDFGYRIRFTSDTFATHAGGGAAQSNLSAAIFYSLRSRLLFARKHYSPALAALLFLLTIFVEPMVRSILAAFRLQFREVFRAAGLMRRLLSCANACWERPPCIERVGTSA